MQTPWFHSGTFLNRQWKSCSILSEREDVRENVFHNFWEKSWHSMMYSHYTSPWSKWSTNIMKGPHATTRQQITYLCAAEFSIIIYKLHIKKPLILKSRIETNYLNGSWAFMKSSLMFSWARNWMVLQNLKFHYHVSSHKPPKVSLPR